MNWRELVVSPCTTHHLANNEPAYSDRFEEVLKFHAPGLAPVRRDGHSWHVHYDGTPAYTRRFKRTFGFYEGIASVVGEEGAFHITITGEDAYPQRFDWCGNFQGGVCTVREQDGAYMHIAPDGRPVYNKRWKYAGDYRDGVSVVQTADGLSTHIDLHGLELHGIWFDDLDVFHKGYARAKDVRGWMHIDMSGTPIYQRRFASVEPFYNGQSRVETTYGGLEVIDESGETVTVLRPDKRTEFAALSGDMVGFWRTETIASAVELGVFEVLPCTAESMAETLGVNVDRLVRLLRALSELFLVERIIDAWHVTERGGYLRKGHPLTLSHAALEFGRHFPVMWSQLSTALRRDEGWEAPNIFEKLALDATRSDLHHQMLCSYAKHDYSDVSAALSLEGNERVIDAGGGLGVLADVLLEQQPNLQLVVLDRPEVIALARSTHTKRHQIHWSDCDFFDKWGLSADAVVLARILHDWDDIDAINILIRARECLSPGGKLFVVEMLMSDADPSGALCDLHLLVVTGGRERTQAQYKELMARTGFTLIEVRKISALSVALICEAT